MSVAVSPTEEGAAPPDARSASAPWVHRTPAGVVIGGDEPSGRPDGLITLFVRALLECWRVRRTLLLLVERDFKARYRAQALGLLWSFANPLVMMIVLSVVFTQFLKVDIRHFPVFLLIGQLLWQFFNNSITAGTASLVDNAQMVKRTIYPRQLIPAAAVLSHALNFLMECTILLVLVAIFPEAFQASFWLLLLPVLLALQLIMLFGITMITSVLNVLYRDVFYVVNSTLLVLFWLTPIIYTTDVVPAHLRPYFALNPLAGIVMGARQILMQGQAPDVQLLLPSAALAVVMFLAGAAFFHRHNTVLSDHL